MTLDIYIQKSFMRRPMGRMALLPYLGSIQVHCITGWKSVVFVMVKRILINWAKKKVSKA